LGVGFLRQAREKRLSIRHYFSQAFDFIEMVLGELWHFCRIPSH